MMQQHPSELAAAWLAAKESEQQAINRRREIEDQLAEFLDITPTDDGIKRATIGSYEVKATTRLNRKVDGQIVQEIAAEHGIQHDVLSTLFRWKPEIDSRNWKNAPKELTDILSKAVTATASRPSFSVTPKE